MEEITIKIIVSKSGRKWASSQCDKCGKWIMCFKMNKHKASHNASVSKINNVVIP